MYRAPLFVAMALAFVLGCGTPAAPSDPMVPPGTGAAVRIPVEKPSLATSACVNGSNQMVVTVTWTAQPIDQTKLLTITASFKGPRLPASPVSQPFVGPYADSSFAVMTLNTFIGSTGPVSWSAWSSIAASASGAFDAKAPALRQPKTGWAAC